MNTNKEVGRAVLPAPPHFSVVSGFIGKKNFRNRITIYTIKKIQTKSLADCGPASPRLPGKRYETHIKKIK